MTFVFIAILVMMAGCFMFVAGSVLVQGLRRIRSWRGLVTVGAAILFLIGTTGFFGSALSALGGLNWLGSFEWPIGYTSNVVRLHDGRYVVPHTPSGRVQVYDAGFRFERGWRIDARGGTFAVRTTPEGNIDIHTARGNRHLLYAPSGRLVADWKYVRDPVAGNELDPPADAISVMIPTRWWLWPMTSPFYAWFCLIAGMLLLGRLDRHDGRRSKRSPAK